MYIPAHFREGEIAALHEMMRQNSFATLVTVVENVPFATHLPILLDAETLPGILRGHVARANPQWQHFESGGEALVIFSGPHAYISPQWYKTQPSVPTWNYTAVHAYGSPRIVTGEALRKSLFDLTAFYEAGLPASWNPAELPDDYLEKMTRALVGFEMPISRLEGKSKLSQNRSETDRQQVIAALESSGLAENVALAAEMRKRS